MMKISTTNHIEFIPVDFDPFTADDFLCVVTAIEPQTEIFASCILGEDDANCSYNESISLKLFGVYNYTAMEKALQELINRHEALRASFSEDGSIMKIRKETTLSIYSNDISEQSNESQKTFISKFILKEVQTPFDLLNGPLFRISLLKIADLEYHFTFTAHHIICDGWSLGIILLDLSKLYSSFANNQVLRLQEAVRYSDYASDQRSFALTKDFKKIEGYWLDLYTEDVPVLDLPTDYPRPSVRTFRSQRDDFKLDAQIASSIKKIGARAGCSFVTTLLIAFEIYLYRLTGQKSIVVGVPAAGQSVTGSFNLVGHCVNLLPIRCEIDETASFFNFLLTQKSVILDAYENQPFTFGSLLKKLKIKRDPSRVPLVPVLFNVDMDFDKGVNFSGLNYELKSNPRVFENFEIFLNLSGSESALMVEWSYNTQLYKQSTIRQWMIGFEQMLVSIIANEKISIKDLSLGSDTKNEAVNWQAQWNKTACKYPGNVSLQKLITAQANLYAEKTAIEFNGEKISYATLEEKSNSLAALILEYGVATGDRIGLAIDRSEKTIICLLAILKTGAAYVPLDPTYPKERVEFMLEDSSASLLITSKKYSLIYNTKVREIVLEDIWKKLSAYPALEPEIKVEGNDLAYILYTSGSTGKPKGVEIEHHNLVNFLCSMQKILSVKDQDSLMAVTTISFDISGMEVYLPLLSGATLILVDGETAKDSNLLLKAIRSAKPTMMQATPSTWQMLLEVGWSELTTIPVLCCGGEAIKKDLADKLLLRCNSLFNLYGPTETTIWSTAKRITSEDEIITIGHPIDNTQIYILDEQLRPVPENAVGEIFIGGEGVARGYWNRESLTREKFLGNPFEKGSKKMYRTGDLGKFLSNGEIQCLGRIDHQVKVRGHRIELEEIEHCISQQEGVSQVVVMAREDQKDDQRLVAYVVPEKHIQQTNSVISHQNWESLDGVVHVPYEFNQKCRQAIMTSLPSYMAPNDIVFLQKLPLTPNGKIDRKKLPKPNVHQQHSSELSTTLTTSTEDMVSCLWQELLRIKRVGLHENFFELGGHSLIAIKLTKALEKKTGVQLPLTSLFEYPTVHLLSKKIDTHFKIIEEEKSKMNSVNWNCLVPIKPSGSKPPLYVVHGAGLNVLFLHTLAGNMDVEQPVYGLQGLGLNGKNDISYNSVEEIAAAYIKEILLQNPKGPYALAGFSMGGLIAFEMAKQLKSIKKNVTFLGMLDAFTYNYSESQSKMERVKQDVAFKIRQQLYGCSLLIKHPEMKFWQLKHFFYKNTHALYHFFKYHAKIDPSDIFFHISKSRKKYVKALRKYRPTPLNCRIDLFKATKHHYYIDDFEYFGWKPYALNGVNVYQFDGDHHQLFGPLVVQKFSLRLQQRLDENNKVEKSKALIENIKVLRAV